MPEAPGDVREELATLVAALRVHAEWQKSSGATGLPVAERELASARMPEAAPPSEPAAPPAAGAMPPADQTPERAQPRPPPPPAENLAPEERVRRLELLAKDVSTCTACRLHSTRTQTVFARGTGSAGLAFVGEGPGADEDEQGYPFVGKAGQLLDRMIEAMGFDRDDVYVANIVKCRPPKNRKPEPDEMATCMPFLEQQLDLIKPEVIVALGATAVQGLLGTTEGITRLRGRWKLYRGRIAVMPTFHPAYLLRNPPAKRDVWNDLQAVLRQMGRAVPPPKKS
jgi:uracil-DNA glycosylase family 4